MLCEDRFGDLAPAQVYATLLDEGRYLCSISTMYRILREHDLARERRRGHRRHGHGAPVVEANAPNQAWSWDISRLRGPTPRTWFYLYVVLDIYSRKIVGWTVDVVESDAVAKRLIRSACEREGVDPHTLTLHSDRGAQMTSTSMAELLEDLGVARSLSRPRTSNDNPYSEANFKTLKYFPEFPERFGSIEDARAFCRRFFAHYNCVHRHSGIGLLTPSDVHHGRAIEIRTARAAVLARAYQHRPDRFVRKPPEPPALPAPAWINKPEPARDDPQADAH